MIMTMELLLIVTGLIGVLTLGVIMDGNKREIVDFIQKKVNED